MLHFKQFLVLFLIIIDILGLSQRVCAYDNNQNWRNSQDLLQVKKNDRYRPAADVHRASKSLENEVDKLMIKPNFRRLILAQSWPRAACAYFNKNDTESFKEFCSPCGIDKKCTNDHWSWHGLWPSNDRNDSIVKKCSHEKFDESIFSTGELKDYRDLMEKKWRGIKHNQYNTYKAARYNNSYKNLWRHEWEKHGTCYGKSQTEYFRTAIELFQKFDLAKILNDRNINPDLDADKNFLEIHDAIKSYPDMNKHVAKIKCKNNRDHFNQEITLIHEVHICFSPYLEVEDCPNVYDSKVEDCNVGKIQYY